MTAFTRENVLHALRVRIEATAPYQITDAAHPDVGGIALPATGIAEPGHVGTAAFIAGSMLCALGGDADPVLLARAAAGCDYLLHAQRESGLIDLRNVNFDSPPDTAFAVQQLAAVLSIGRQMGRNDLAWGVFAERAETFLRRSAHGVATGGFHTPNHRWVIAGAIAQLAALFPDLAPDLEEPMRAYLAEGFDADAEGAYLERSVGVYDAVTNRSLLLVAHYWPDEAVRAAAFASVRANLDFNLHLLHADATAETGLSRRQDVGTRPVPLALAAPLFEAGIALAEPRYLGTAVTLWEADWRDDGHRLVDFLWLAHSLLAYGGPLPDRAALPPPPDTYTRLYERNGLWRVRRGPLSLTAFRDMPRVLGIVYGAAELVALLGQSQLLRHGPLRRPNTHGRRRYRHPHLRRAGRRAASPRLRLAARSPGATRRMARHPQRARLPPLPPGVGHTDGSCLCRTAAKFATAQRAGTMASRHRSPSISPPAVSGKRAIPRLHPQPGQTLFLTSGSGTMRYGAHALTVGPGAGAHRVWSMRDATPPTPDAVRVLLALLTPTDHAFTIRGVAGSVPR